MRKDRASCTNPEYKEEYKEGKGKNYSIRIMCNPWNAEYWIAYQNIFQEIASRNLEFSASPNSGDYKHNAVRVFVNFNNISQSFNPAYNPKEKSELLKKNWTK